MVCYKAVFIFIFIFHFLLHRMNSSRGFYKPRAGGYQGPRHYRGGGGGGGRPFRGRGRGRGRGW